MRVIRQIKVSAYDQFFGGDVQVLRTVHILFGLRMSKAKYARSVPPHECGEGSSRVDAVTGLQPQPFEHREETRETYRKGREQKMEADGEGKLNAGEQYRPFLFDHDLSLGQVMRGNSQRRISASLRVSSAKAPGPWAHRNRSAPRIATFLNNGPT